MDKQKRVYTAKDFMKYTQTTEQLSEEYNISFWRRFWEGLKKNKLAMVCLVILIIVVIASLAAPLSPYDPDAMDSGEKLLTPSASHLFGTDLYGRDYFTRALYGGRISLAVGIGAAICSVIVGTIIGTFSGYLGGKIDVLLMRFTDCFMALPSFLIMIVLNAFFKPGVVTLILVISLFAWPSMARIARAETMSIKERDYVVASKNMGAPHIWIIFWHIIPNMVGSITVTASLIVASAILTESSLSYLGLGVQLPMASWGSMLQDAQATFLKLPSLSVYPGLLIVLTVLSFNTVGNVLRDALEPKSYR